MVSEEMLLLGRKRFVIRDIFSMAQQRKAVVGDENVFDFSIGNPNVPVPHQVKEAIEDMINTMPDVDIHGYSNASGFEDVKQTVIDHINTVYHRKYETKDLFLTCGAAAALTIALRALINPGEEVMVIAPHYPEYPSFIQSARGKTVIVPHDPEAMQINFEAFEKLLTEKTKAVIVNSPNNPSGAVYTEETIKRLADLLKERSEEYGHPIYIVSDEPYREIVFDGWKVPYIPDYYTDTLICYSYSKSLSLPGHRIGYLLMPYDSTSIEDIRTAVPGAARILGFVQAPAFAQRIIQRCVDVLADMKLYENNRDLFYGTLSQYGFQCIKPQGAFYLFMKSPDENVEKFVENGRKYNLFYAPGEDFGCPDYVRISFCIAPETIQKSLPLFEKLANDYHLKGGTK